jgi:drebrin-like protein
VKPAPRTTGKLTWSERQALTKKQREEEEDRSRQAIAAGAVAAGTGVVGAGVIAATRNAVDLVQQEEVSHWVDSGPPPPPPAPPAPVLPPQVEPEPVEEEESPPPVSINYRRRYPY